MKLIIEHGDECYEFEENGYEFAVECKDSNNNKYVILGAIDTNALENMDCKTIEIDSMVINIRKYKCDMLDLFLENYKGEMLIEITINDFKYTFYK